MAVMWPSLFKLMTTSYLQELILSPTSTRMVTLWNQVTQNPCLVELTVTPITNVPPTMLTFCTSCCLGAIQQADTAAYALDLFTPHWGPGFTNLRGPTPRMVRGRFWMQICKVDEPCISDLRKAHHLKSDMSRVVSLLNSYDLVDLA